MRAGHHRRRNTRTILAVVEADGNPRQFAGPIPESEEAAHGKRGGRRGVFFIVHPDREQLSQIATLIDAGAVRPVIAQTVPLAEAREAFERGVAGHTRGKLVLAVDKP